VPGLIAMTIIFSTTAAEAVVINFELRLGSLERLLLAPISLPAVLLGKVIGGTIFGFMMTVVVTLGSVLTLGLFNVSVLYLALIIVPSLLVFSSLGALLCVLVKEVFEAQTLLNLPRFIMVFLCGVVYPVSAMPSALQFIAYLMPLTYTVDGLRQAFPPNSGTIIFVDTLVLIGFFTLFILPAIKLLQRRFA
jgi:ABC-2 type transport system permease protein